MKIIKPPFLRFSGLWSVVDGVTMPSECGWIQFILTIESFVGVLFSGFCGAILFGKITRMQSQAQVVFSDPLVIRYGNGLRCPSEEDSSSSDDEKNRDSLEKIPCPIVEFRIINKKGNVFGGEIVDASITCVSANDVYFKASNFSAGSVFGSYLKRNDVTDTNEVVEEGSENEPVKRTASRKVFNTLEVDSATHPFFKRVWLVRHTLN
jgi:hypothetical protein